MNSRRIGIILFMVLAIVAITSFGGAHGVKPIQVAHSQDSGGCTGCSTDMACYQCHIMNYYWENAVNYGCIGCSSNYPYKLKSDQWRRDSVTGNKLSFVKGFEKLPLPPDHKQSAIDFHKKPNPCQRKMSTITE